MPPALADGLFTVSHQEIQVIPQLSAAKYWENFVTELVNLKVKDNKRKRCLGKVV